MSVSLEKILKEIDGEVLTEGNDLSNIQITGGYVSDLLSDVMGNAKDNQVWITIMKHLNTVAVASLANLNCIIFSNNNKPEDSVIKKASDEKITLIKTKYPSFETAGIIYSLLQNVK